MQLPGLGHDDSSPDDDKPHAYLLTFIAIIKFAGLVTCVGRARAVTAIYRELSKPLNTKLNSKPRQFILIYFTFFQPRERGRMRFHAIQNVETALRFLRYKEIKLVNIRGEDIVDGNPKLTLGLIWTIILHFQVGDALVQIFFSPIFFPFPKCTF